MSFFYHFGQYIQMLGATFSRPEKRAIYIKRTMEEGNAIGVGSLSIIAIISVFVGMVTTINTAYQLVSAFLPRKVIGEVVGTSAILELSPTICSLVLAGKVGSNIATELGSMRVSEQIDAMDTMGVNSKGYLIFPKIIAAIFVIPMLILISMGLSIGGGIFIGQVTGVVSPAQFIDGARANFETYTFVFALIKTFCFAFIISSVSAYQGYYMSGGSIEVGKASTRAVVYSCVLILLSDYLLAQLFL